MAPPSRKGGVGLETKEALSAIVLADSFTQVSAFTSRAGDGL